MSADAAFFDSDLVCPGNSMKEGGEQKVEFSQPVDDEGASVICTGGKDGTDTYIAGDTIVTCGTVNPDGSGGDAFYLKHTHSLLLSQQGCTGGGAAFEGGGRCEPTLLAWRKNHI